MGFTVTFYKFEKKKNSTLRPVSPPAIGYPIYDFTTFNNVELKSECDILSPTVIINLGREFRYIPNYCYIEEFERYYFVNSMKWNNGMWEMGLSVDVLASWRTDIGNQSLYVERSASDYDGTVMDTLYPAKSGVIRQLDQLTTFWDTTDITAGTYVVGVAGQNTQYYTFTYSGLQLFLQYILGTTYINALQTGWGAVYTNLQFEANPLQYITSIKWFPFFYAGSTPPASIRVGFVNVPSAPLGQILGSGLTFFSKIFAGLNRHPQASTRGSYLNNAPYSTYELFYPPFGQITLDPDLVANTTEIEALVGVDMRTGDGTLTILDNDNNIIANWLHSPIATNYQTTEIVNKGGFDVSKATQIVSAGAIGFATGGAIGAGIGAGSSILSTVGDSVKAKIPSARTIGSQGGMNALRGDVLLQYEFKNLVDESNVDRGRPLCQVRTLNTLSGYIKVSSADINIATSDLEIDMIREHLERGFFYE